MEKGYVQVYTGDGKGKTTAALGIALRCVCAGNRVFFGQFMKGQGSSEQRAVEYLPGFQIEQFGDLHFINGEPSERDIKQAYSGLEKMKGVLLSGEYDMVVFDEINTAAALGLIHSQDVLSALGCRPSHVEVILTGRYAPEEFKEYADLVTEMKEIKHYYNAGVEARIGVEK